MLYLLLSSVRLYNLCQGVCTGESLLCTLVIAFPSMAVLCTFIYPSRCTMQKASAVLFSTSSTESVFSHPASLPVYTAASVVRRASLSLENERPPTLGPCDWTG